jgi:hypothetical protein
MKPLSFYTYSRPVVLIQWNNHIQPGRYFSAIEALNNIKQTNIFPNKKDVWEICTPEGKINISDIVNNQTL